MKVTGSPSYATTTVKLTLTGWRQEKRQKRNDEKVKDATNLYVCVWIFEKSKTCKTSRFFVLKILIKIDTTKILRFNRQPNQKSKVHVCVSFWMTIFIHVCVLKPWTRFSSRIDPRLQLFLWKPTINDFTKREKKCTSEIGLSLRKKVWFATKSLNFFWQPFLWWNIREKKKLYKHARNSIAKWMTFH